MLPALEERVELSEDVRCTTMNRKLFLERLEHLWHDNAEYKTDLTIEDLLDDAATIGLEGASELYLKGLQKTKK